MTVEAGPKTGPITIRKVPREVRDELASRAALEGKSLQRYLLDLLEQSVRFPTPAMLMVEFRERNRVAGTQVPVEANPVAGGADRR